ncbi:uncharacterized protein LOC143888106 [Tasmannia lanceolata]|uniref:uncharacterized protein LOC143888106 n=1 Tax=Tasmannia lanceolata TaxID=3420 RepID=UPI0040646615
MMGIFDEGEDMFFDTREDLSSVSDSGSDCVEVLEPNCKFLDWVSGKFQNEIWVGKLESVQERRDKFLKWMGLGLDGSPRRDSVDLSDKISPEIDRITKDSGAVLRNSDFEDGFSSSWSNRSDDAPDLSVVGVSEGNSLCRIRNLDDGTEFIVDELGQDGTLSRLREVGSDRVYTVDEFQSMLGLSPFIQQFMRREVAQSSNSNGVAKRRKKGWLRRLGAVACVVDRQQEEGKLGSDYLYPITRVRAHRVRVRLYKKRSKEFSAVYMGQEIEAHSGSILTMKFSLDGQYLASAGEDGVVRVWQVMDCARTDDNDIPEVDPSCIYFTVNHSSELSPLFADKETMSKFSSMRKTSDSACIILPPTVFRISEKPLHEFHGHSDDVLDLSWSKNKYLLSSSVDKTVRLWQVGCDSCLKVFSHNNYVTCVQFNPVDDNYFISGSIDGKVRIWAIPGCQVVDWIDIREIVTAVCYCPDGQGGVVGSMTGNCRFFDASGNHLQLDAQICLQGKKKSPCKRITGFEFCPSDPRKIMVTSADSQVRILDVDVACKDRDGVDVVCKYRGIRNAGSQISASFTRDGKHIISASEDSNVYIWNYNSLLNRPMPSQAKSVWSYERFFSSNVSVAIPWSRVKSGNPVSLTSENIAAHQQVLSDSTRSLQNLCNCHSFSSNKSLSLSLSDHFSLSHGFLSEVPPKGSATWPEEKLPTSSSLTVSSTMCKSQYKFLKASCQNAVTSSHAWGVVIVTAGWDGRIRSFHNYGLPVHV